MIWIELKSNVEYGNKLKARPEKLNLQGKKKNEEKTRKKKLLVQLNLVVLVLNLILNHFKSDRETD